MDVDSPALEDASRRRAANLLRNGGSQLGAAGGERVNRRLYGFEKYPGDPVRIVVRDSGFPEAAHLRAQYRVGSDYLDGVGPSLRIVAFNQSGVRHNFGNCRFMVSNDGLACRHGFEQDDAETFLKTREAENVGVRVFRRELLLAEIAKKGDTILQTQLIRKGAPVPAFRTVADDPQLIAAAAAEDGKRPQQQRQILAWIEAADGQQPNDCLGWPWRNMCEQSTPCRKVDQFRNDF